MSTKEKRKQRKNSSKGITLIALVVTIIVLIILAGVSIAMVVGDNGIITQAQRASKETSNSTIASEEQMNALVDEVNKHITGNGEVGDTENTIPVSELKAGDYIKYNSGTNGEILCRVLYPADSEYGLQIISDKNVKTVTLGVVDDFEASKIVYNNAIETLNNEAEAYINPDYATDARCVGSVATVKSGIFTQKNSETAGPFTMEFEYNGSTSIDFKRIDTNYIVDKGQMEKYDLWTTGEKYWLASHDIYSDSSVCYFGVRNINALGVLEAYALCGISSSGSAEGDANKYGLRPCILLKSDIKINAEEGKDGSSADKAYVIE